MNPLGYYPFSTFPALGKMLYRASSSVLSSIRKVFNNQERIETNATVNNNAKNPIFVTEAISHYFTASDKNNIFQADCGPITSNTEELLQSTKKNNLRKKNYNKKSLTRSISTMSETIIFSGVFGEVSMDNSGFVTKKFKSLDEINLPDNLKSKIDIYQMATEEVALFNLYYGIDSARLHKEDNTVYIIMKQIEGVTIDNLDDGEFEKIMLANVRPFYEMMKKLFTLHIIHGDFLIKNIIYHKENFFPIDMCNSTSETLISNLEIMKSLIDLIKNKDEKIDLTWNHHDTKNNIILTYSNKSNATLNDSCEISFTSL